MRSHLRGFSRTIPSFIMAYGDKNLNLRNFDDYTEDDVWFDEQSCGFSVKLVKCPRCGGISRIKYYEDKNLDVNNDERFYEYRR